MLFVSQTLSTLQSDGSFRKEQQPDGCVSRAGEQMVASTQAMRSCGGSLKVMTTKHLTKPDAILPHQETNVVYCLCIYLTLHQPTNESTSHETKRPAQRPRAYNFAANRQLQNQGSLLHRLSQDRQSSQGTTQEPEPVLEDDGSENECQLLPPF